MYVILSRPSLGKKSDYSRVIRVTGFIERAMCTKGVSSSRHSFPFDITVSLILFSSRRCLCASQGLKTFHPETDEKQNKSLE